jgi:hypothetical protein
LPTSIVLRHLICCIDAEPREAAARLPNDVLEAHVGQLGGFDCVTHSEMALVRRCSTLIVELERRETQFAKVGEIDDVSLAIYQTSCGALRRMLETLGIKADPARAKTITPLEDLIAELSPPTAGGSADARTLAWAKTYLELRQGFTEALGGEQITAPRKALADTLAVAQTELAMLSSRFASSGGGASAADLQIFIKLSDTVGALLESAGLGKSMREQAIPDPHDAERDAAALRDIFERIVGARQEEEARGIFRDRDGTIINTASHPAGCCCEPCTWRRNQDTTVSASPAGDSTPAAASEPAVVSTTTPPPRNLRVVPPLAPPPKAEPEPVQPAAGDLLEQRRALSVRCDDLRRQIHQLAERALVDADTRARRDRLQADLVLLESDLSQLNTTIAKQTPPSEATRLFYESNGGGCSGFDISPGPTWPRLRG